MFQSDIFRTKQGNKINCNRTGFFDSESYRISTLMWLGFRCIKRANGQFSIQFPIRKRLFAPTSKTNRHIFLLSDSGQCNDTVRQLKCQSICNNQSIKNTIENRMKKTHFTTVSSSRAMGNSNKKQKISHWEIAN